MSCVHRSPIKGHLAAVASALALMVAGAASTRAEDLPAALLAAAKAMPIEPGGRETCLAIQGLNNDIRVQTVDQPDQSDADRYSLQTTGAWLGDTPDQQAPSPLVQALLDDDVATRRVLVWRGASNGEMVEMRGTAYLVAGPAQQYFRRDQAAWPAQPPVQLNTSPSTDVASRRTETPPGVWSTSHVCYPLSAVRVLEYADPEGPPGGRRIVTAAILFKPTVPLPWLKDPRVTTALDPRTGYMQPAEVRLIPFENDGDGWRVAPYLLQRLEQVPAHIIGSD